MTQRWSMLLLGCLVVLTISCAGGRALIPQTADDHVDNAIEHNQNKEYDKAIAECNAAILKDPSMAAAYLQRGIAYERKKIYDRAVADYRKALSLDSDDADAHNDLAWLLATCPRDDIRNGKEALEHAHTACDIEDTADHWDTLAAAFAEMGQFDEALVWQQKALADPEFRKEHGKDGNKRLSLYKQRKPFRDENP